MPWRAAETTVAGDDCRVEGLGQCHIRRVADTAVSTQLPHAFREIDMAVTDDSKQREVGNCCVGLVRQDLAAALQAPQRAQDFNVEEVRRMKISIAVQPLFDFQPERGNEQKLRYR